MLYKLISCAQYEWEFEGCSWAFFFLVTQLEWKLRRSEMMSDQHPGLLCASEGRLQGHKLRPFIFQAKRKKELSFPRWVLRMLGPTGGLHLLSIRYLLAHLCHGRQPGPSPLSVTEH